MVFAAEQLASAGLHGDAWARETTSHVEDEVRDLLQPMDSGRDCGAFGAPGALGESDPRFDGSALGPMLNAALRKALNLWERVEALG